MKQPTPLEIEHETRGDVDLVRLRGELDLTNATALHDGVSATSSRSVVVDLTGVVFVDSAGIRAIDSEVKRLRASERLLLIVAPPDSRAGWTFRVAGFSTDFVHESVAAATRATQG